MTNHESPSYLGRMFKAIMCALKRGILGKSTHDYSKQFTGSDEYWDRIIAAQIGWPMQHLPKHDPHGDVPFTPVITLSCRWQ